jgi:hypothetical protein
MVPAGTTTKDASSSSLSLLESMAYGLFVGVVQSVYERQIRYAHLSEARRRLANSAKCLKRVRRIPLHR